MAGAPLGAAVQMFQTLAGTQHCRAPRPCLRNGAQQARSLASQGSPLLCNAHSNIAESAPVTAKIPYPENHKYFLYPSSLGLRNKEWKAKKDG